MPKHYLKMNEENVPEKKERASASEGDNLQINALETKALKHKSPPAMQMIGIKHPFSMGIFGASGSGKTVLTCSILLKKNMYNKYFHEVYLITPTGGADDTFELLGLPKSQIITSDYIENLKKIIAQQENEVEQKGVIDAKKVCVIFEDLTSLKKLMNSEPFLKAFVQNRHLNMSCIAVCHKYRALNRTARMNCNHLIFFPVNNSEREIIMEENMTPQWNKRTFQSMLQHAFTPNEQSKRPFLHINNKADQKERFRKNFTAILKPPSS